MMMNDIDQVIRDIEPNPKAVQNILDAMIDAVEDRVMDYANQLADEMLPDAIAALDFEDQDDEDFMTERIIYPIMDRIFTAVADTLRDDRN